MGNLDDRRNVLNILIHGGGSLSPAVESAMSVVVNKRSADQKDRLLVADAYEVVMDGRVAQEIGEVCWHILRGTNDGDDLSADALALLQMAINLPNSLSFLGLKEIASLYVSVMDHSYIKPWHLGVEHMTKTHEGYVYYKGTVVEHYTYCHDIGNVRERRDLMALQKRCLDLEACGIEVNCRTVLGYSQWIGDENESAYV